MSNALLVIDFWGVISKSAMIIDSLHFELPEKTTLATLAKSVELQAPEESDQIGSRPGSQVKKDGEEVHR